MGANLKAFSNNKVSVLSVLSVFVLFGLVFVSGNVSFTLNAPAANQQIGTIVTVNITLNNTNPSALFNITNVTITFSTNKTYVLNTNKTTSANSVVFTNSTQQNLTFFNESSLVPYNGSQIVNFLFNVSIGNETNGTINFFNITTYYANSVNNPNTTLLNFTVIDSVFPNVSSINNPVAGANITDIVAFNVTIVENKPDTVYFNVTNSTGQQVLILTPSNLTATVYNFTHNTTNNLTDGRYNVTVYVNDTNNNLNKSEVRTFFVNNNPPIVVLTCTPNPVTQSSTITCSCSVTDTVDTSPTSSYTTNPSTGQSGTFSTTCTGTDSFNNKSTTATISYTVEGSSGGSSGGGGASTTTPAVTHSHIIGSVAAGEIARTTVTKTKVSELGISEIIINVINSANNVKITITKLDGKPASVTQEVSGIVYKYMQVNVDGIPNSNIASSKAKFQVPKSWVADNKIDKNKVLLAHYNGEGEKLTTMLLSEDVDNYYYEADVKAFSPFAIVGEELVAEPTQPEQPGEQPTEPEQPGEEPTTQPEPMNPLLIVGVIVVVIIVLAGLFLATKKKK